MALIAVTDINLGQYVASGECEFHYFSAGEEINESVFTDEQLKDLKTNGAVEESKQLEEMQDLRSQVEELQRQLAAMESEHASKDNAVTNARNVDQSALNPLNGVPAGTVVTEEYAREHGLDVPSPAGKEEVVEEKAAPKAADKKFPPVQPSAQVPP